MARISFSATVDEIIGKLGGSVFQYSYGGWQVHVKGKPRNPQTQYQQLRRGDFGFLSASWRGLSSVQRQTFIDAALTAPEGFNLFLKTNINLILIEVPTVTSYVPTAVPTDFPCEITDVNPSQYLIKASGATTVVPANTKLLLYSTSEKAQTKIFTNPSEYSPIISFDEGTDLSTDTSILTAYNTRFGQLQGDKRLCIKTVLLSKINGSRGPESITCTNTDTMANYFKTLTTFPNDAATAGIGFELLNLFTIPANTLINNGDRILLEATLSFLNNGNSKTLSVYFAGASSSSYDSVIAGSARLVADIMRVDATHIRLGWTVTQGTAFAASVMAVDYHSFLIADATAANDIAIAARSINAAGDIIVREESICLIKAIP